MYYGKEMYTPASADFDKGKASQQSMGSLFENAICLTDFEGSADQTFINTSNVKGLSDSISFRVDHNSLLEINNAFLRSRCILRNDVADLISFQFSSSVKRLELVGERRNTHDLGPALIVSVVPRRETTYRIPEVNVRIQHIVVHTTLSDLLSRTGEPADAYPKWLINLIDGRHTKPFQRVFFLDDIHRGLIWSCFNLPVSGTLLPRWLNAKFEEFLSIGLEILKNSKNTTEHSQRVKALPHSEKLRRALAILSMEYVNPPAITTLAKQLGISETALKSGFRSLTGTTIMQYCLTKRMEAAGLLLKENRRSIFEIGNIVGYEDHSAFTRAFRRHMGVSPREWRDREL